MGSIIRKHASVEKIAEVFRLVFKVAFTRTPDVVAAANQYLKPGIDALDDALARRKEVADAEETARLTMMTENDKVKRLIANVRDQFYNALGRPRTSEILSFVFPDGLATYAPSNVHDRPAAMEVLQARLLSVQAAGLTPELQASLAAQIDTGRQALDAKVVIHRPLVVKLDIANTTYASIVLQALQRLHAFKHQLKIGGMTEAQIHDIIPDATPPARASKAAPTPPSNPGGTPATPAGSSSGPEGSPPPVSPVHSTGG